MRTVDTNVLVRAFVGDDPVASEAAKRFLQVTEPLHVPIVVLCEFVWTLRSSYRFTKPSLADAVRTVIGIQSVRTDRDAAQAGLAMLDRGGDFADGVILHEARRTGSYKVGTFDRQFARLGAPDVTLLS